MEAEDADDVDADEEENNEIDDDGGDDGFDISGSFQCLNPSKAVKGGGKITEIGADYIGITNYDGHK